MPHPIERIELPQFVGLLYQYDWLRKVEAIHLHCTDVPRHADWRGRATVEAMRRVHVEERHFSDIAQHLTIDPYGGLWTGRNWNQPPASAKGGPNKDKRWNGTDKLGPFMIEMVGLFEPGKDAFGGTQRAAAIEVMAWLLLRFKLGDKDIVAHHTMYPGKTCPGTLITTKWDALLKEVGDKKKALSPLAPEQRSTPARGLPTALARFVALPDEARSTREADRQNVEEYAVPEGDDVGQRIRDATEAMVGSQPGAVGRGLNIDLWKSLDGHVVNTVFGRLLPETDSDTDSGDYVTRPSDLSDKIIAGLREFAEEREDKGPLRIMLHAHGGLVGEGDALRYAKDHVRWWKAQDVYPIYFIWETGLMETLLMRKRSLDARGSDDLIEAATARLGTFAWTRMKLNAMLASSSDWVTDYRNTNLPQRRVNDLNEGERGGAREFASRLAELIAEWSLPAVATTGGASAKKPQLVEIHAVGHSAGSIFHAYWLPAMLDELKRRGVPEPRIHSLSLLAPAVHVDLFMEKVQPLFENDKSISRMAMFTMDTVRENDDNVFKIYRKSLLHLVRNAFEPAIEDDALNDSGKPVMLKAAILGLQHCIKADPVLADLFNVKGRSYLHLSDGRESGSNGRHYTTATAHGDFDNDATTMQSVLALIHGAPVADPDVKSIASQNGTVGKATSSRVDAYARAFPTEKGFLTKLIQKLASSAATKSINAERQNLSSRASGPSRRALCIGIDRYRERPLAGCVNDSRTWGKALTRIGYEVNYLHDEQADLDGLRNGIRNFLDTARNGDSVVIQYAGHGTQFADASGSEVDGFNEALVPFDYTEAGCLLDDEMHDLLSGHAGKHIVLFLDSCHAGTASRFAPALRADGNSGLRTRFLPLGDDIARLHRNRQRVGPSARSADFVQWLHFAACHDNEFAYESNAQGDFTAAATPLLEVAARDGWTAQRLLEEARKRMAVPGRQSPQLMKSDSDKMAMPIFTMVAPASLIGSASEGDLADEMRGIARALERLADRMS